MKWQDNPLVDFVLFLFVCVLFVIGLLVRPADAGGPEPSFPPDVQPSPICGLYPGWEPGVEFGPDPGDVVECPPDEFPIGPNPSGLPPEVLAPASVTPRPTPTVVGEPSPNTATAEGSEIPAVWSSDLPATDTER